MPREKAIFEYVEGYYWPMNNAAARIGYILSKRRLRLDDMLAVRSKGFIPIDTNGVEIGRVKVKV